MNKKLMVDIVIIEVVAGKGGDGMVSFHRNILRPKGGPDGGDGGKGGDVYFEGDANMATLMDFRSKTSYKAQGGQPGGGKQMTGANGEDLLIRIPQGTQIIELRGKRETLVGDMTKDNQRILLARGGNGGKGNTRFKSSTNRTPYEFTYGLSGDRKRIKLEIKLIADVGLVGLPNAGKSTLINQMAGTSAKVGSYPFTTLAPNLGVCLLKNGRTAIVADLPGLIEGASKGKGLGGEFLRHLERTKLIVHLIDPYNYENEPFDSYAKSSYRTIRGELDNYGAGLDGKKEIVVINKIDLTEVKDALPEMVRAFKELGVSVLGISAATGEGTEELKDMIMNELEKVVEEPGFDVKSPVKVYTINNLPNKRIVFRSEGR